MQTNEINLTNDDYFAISRELEHHHAIFYKMWELGRPVFTEEIKTAAIRFDREGHQIAFLFNPKFWNYLTPYERQFVISHETLHVILSHGLRSKDAENPLIANQALDVVVNHTLCSKFGFDRNQIRDWKNLCWVDTLFDVCYPTTESFEFYYAKLKEDAPPPLVIVAISGKGGKSDKGDGDGDYQPYKGKGELVDEHSGLGDDSDDLDDMIDELGRSLTEEEKESVEQMVQEHSQRGTEAGSIWKIVKVEIKRKKKWETVIKKWSKKYDKPEFHDVEQWARINRRLATLSSDLMLPSDMEIEHEEEGRIEVWFFQDTSGSCSHFADRFFKAAASLDPKRFDIKLHCFDTKVYETTIKSGKLYGFGGTSFRILEAYIQASMKKHETEYPKAVFVITDGYGDRVHPQNGKVWYWFLSGAYDSCIPKDSHVYKLKDFE